ncbi:hypothetical protein E5K00_10290 [Hymenobacter aquaticus]|uniref:HNH endonuclease 5 domain-containing protein n=1 Tax=Hymenobacter aquaticus TaxID=1867101 RepID=A0A4Z0Q622_9BACT|nr:hypothetical protein [Hymenobacter aquaticus]TGE25550.1 hypothetical protein E5K00_10290 [Hymenobacter aquaticus]
MLCLFCKVGDQFNTVEHIIPESLGNDDLILQNEVCDSCQKHFSHIENYILNKTPIGFWRTLLGIKSKHRKLPRIDFTKPNNKKGRFTDSHPEHDNFTLEAQDDFTAIIEIPEKEKPLGGKDQLKYIMTPKVLNELGRFLGKVGLELICLQDRESSRKALFDKIRTYSRYGSLNELWPIFHYSQGNIDDLVKFKKDSKDVLATVQCYSYSIDQIETYTVFRFNVGTDNWCICLNDMFPTSVIKQLFLPHDIKLLWYTQDQWKSK